MGRGTAAQGRSVSDPSASDAGPQSGDPASFGHRAVALCVDWLLCVLIASLFADVPYTGLWAYPLLVAEYGFFLGVFGQTPGMRLLRARCVSVRDGAPIGVLRALLRGVLLCPIVPALLMTADGRGLHDRAAGSIIVRA